MKSKFKKASLLLTGIMVGGKLFAQTPDSTMTDKNYVQPFSHGGLRTWSIGIEGGLLTPYTIFSPSQQDYKSPHQEFGYSGFIKDQFLPELGIQADYLGGKVNGAVTAADQGAGTYSSYSTKIHYAVDLMATYTLANINWAHKKSFIQPYVSVGGGEISYTATVNNNGTNVGNKQHDFYIPVGAGFKIDVAKGINLDLGYQVNFVNADDFDGTVVGNGNDRFSYAHAGLEFALGSRSKPQMATYNPVNSMRTEYLMDDQRLQIQLDQERAANGQLRNDLNTTNANLAKLTVDSDGDGVPDVYDKCPNTPAGTQVDGAGCPLPVRKPDVKVYVTKEDKEVVNEAVKNLEFDFGKSTIREHSDESLNKLAQLLVNKGFSLKLAGYTDNVGSVSANLKLSKDRAEAVKTYLATQGVDPSKISAEGYGKAHPIATNKTDKGRQINRRVEFSIY
ncbi:MAG: OmpA family protein [Sphingobacteriales bacterium]